MVVLCRFLELFVVAVLVVDAGFERFLKIVADDGWSVAVWEVVSSRGMMRVASADCARVVTIVYQRTE